MNELGRINGAVLADFRVAKTHIRHDRVKLNRTQRGQLIWSALIQHTFIQHELSRKPTVNKPNIDSPFLKVQPRKLSFSSILILLLMVVFAGMGLLVYNALNVPAITNELDAWLGRQSKSVETADSREAQIIFVMFCYSAPLMLGILVHSLHMVINFFDRRQRELDREDDEAFRMTD